ncbi:MAG TPA: glycosyltransferase family 4 protein [Gammaproteobacteria bacterium]|nr:glycosyltransferase family 4 protein [Gammaproteobacteria bacterium]
MGSVAWLPVFGAFIVALALTRRFLSPGSGLYILDHPNERSLHAVPVPRTGGVAIGAATALGAVAAAWFAPPPPGLAWAGIGAVLLAGVGFLDDRFGVGPSKRLLVQLAAAGLAAVGGLWIKWLALPGASLVLAAPLGITVTVLFVVWFVNLYNFMDGMDGFAGGMAAFGFGTLAVIGAVGHEPAFASLNGVVAAAAAGFLVYNFPPARIFMGDVGSSVLGYLAAVSSLWGVRAGLFGIWVPVLIFSPFIVDATLTLAGRLLQGERIWEAHRSHYYQRLVQLGWGHRRTVLTEYGLMAAAALCAVSSGFLSAVAQWAMLGFWVAAYGVIWVHVERIKRRGKGVSHR